MNSWHGGKGSTQRKVDSKKYNENWDKIFGNKKTAETETKMENKKNVDN